MTYHINTVTQKVGRCTTTPDKCPVSDKSSHFSTIEEAKAENENRLAKAYGYLTSVAPYDKDLVNDLRELTNDNRYDAKNNKKIYNDFMNSVKNNENRQQIVDVIMIECKRQHVGFERVESLINAYNVFNDDLSNGTVLDYLYVEKLGGLAEPDNKGRYRVSPVTFASGGSAAKHQDVERLMFNLFEYGDQLSVDEFTKQFLWIHPFNDGNGRTAWLLYNWRNQTLNNPVRMPEYF